MPAQRATRSPRQGSKRHRLVYLGTRGSAKFLLMPEARHKGKSHMPMMDMNNLAIADLIIGWLGESVATR
jgi:hypothetical protein